MSASRCRAVIHAVLSQSNKLVKSKRLRFISCLQNCEAFQNKSNKSNHSDGLKTDIDFYVIKHAVSQASNRYCYHHHYY